MILFICFVLFISIILINSLQIDEFEILRTDCYESFTLPRQYIELSHYFPSGPLYIIVHFTYHLYSYIFGYISKNIRFKYFFKRIDKPCNTSIIYSTFGKDFKRLNLIMMIHIYEKKISIASMNYTFYAGFNPGLQNLTDENLNFILHVPVTDSVEHFFTSLRLDKESDAYLNSLTGGNGELCIITENNRAVVLTPDYGLYKSLGLIIGFRADIFINQRFYYTREYQAFECNKSQDYPNEKIIFVFDDHRISVMFSAIYRERLLFNEVVGSKIFDPSNCSLEHLYYYNNFPKSYKKVFLIKESIDTIECPDESRAIIYVSQDGVGYYAHVYKQVNILTSVMHGRYIRTSPSDPCT